MTSSMTTSTTTALILERTAVLEEEVQRQAERGEHADDEADAQNCEEDQGGRPKGDHGVKVGVIGEVGVGKGRQRGLRRNQGSRRGNGHGKVFGWEFLKSKVLFGVLF